MPASAALLRTLDHSLAGESGTFEQHRRALVLLAALELVGLLDGLDVSEREADRGGADAEWDASGA